jgi:N6-adenosine-specific RNA methylase IME4
MIEPLPMGPFRVISADPAWPFETFSEAGKGKSPERHYPTMEIEEICAMPVRDVAADDCALFIWTTWPNIFNTERVIKAWGFRYSGLAWEWIKRNPETGKYAFGVGYGTRKNLEPCLLATRGSPKLLSRSVRDFLYAPRREHSRKPDEHFERIETMYRGPYLELFARESRPGWAAWGNETDRFDGKADRGAPPSNPPALSPARMTRRERTPTAETRSLFDP